MNEDGIEGKTREAGGLLGQTVGSLQDGYGRVRGKVRDIADDLPEAARDAYAAGRDYAQRGAVTVSRVATDNTALTALVAGVAVAAVGWLVLGRRRKGYESTREDGTGTRA